MLNNTVYIRPVFSSEGVIGLTKIDTDNGSSVYAYNAAANDTYTLRVQQLTTKENPPVGSKRVQLRLSRTKILDDGSERTIFCSMAFSYPRDVSYTASEQSTLLRAFVSLLMGDIEDSTPITMPNQWAAWSDVGPTLFTRLLTGEV